MKYEVELWATITSIYTKTVEVEADTEDAAENLADELADAAGDEIGDDFDPEDWDLWNQVLARGVEPGILEPIGYDKAAARQLFDEMGKDLTRGLHELSTLEAKPTSTTDK